MTASDRTAGRARVVGYAYPWDVVGDPGFADRVRSFGVTKVAMAGAYHTARAATPSHPRSRLVNARTAALYRPVRREAWRGRRLVPATAEWVHDDDPFGAASTALADAGIEVAAWIVLTHSSRLGDAHPDVAVVNCFDEPYPYALCPQSEEVRDYTATLTTEVLRDVPCSGVVLEACGQLGVQHGGHHEKTDGAYDQHIQRLLSICCCTACRAAWQAEGLAPGEVVATLRAAVDAEAARERPDARPNPSSELLEALLRVRHAGMDALRSSVIDAAKDAAGPLEIALHAQPDPWATGALPGLTATAPDDVDVVVAQCWATGRQSIENARRLTTALADRAIPGAYVTVLPPTAPGDFPPHLAALEEVGVEETHLYHLGLAGPDRQDMLAQATRPSPRPR